MPRRKRRPARGAGADEPTFDEAELEWSGGQLIHVVGHTEAAFAYGAPVAELRRDAERDARGAGWARAKHVLRALLELELGPVREIGRVTKIGDGLAREIFAAEVELTDGRVDGFVVALPRRGADARLDERTRRELRLVANLHQRGFRSGFPR